MRLAAWHGPCRQGGKGAHSGAAVSFKGGSGHTKAPVSVDSSCLTKRAPTSNSAGVCSGSRVGGAHVPPHLCIQLQMPWATLARTRATPKSQTHVGCRANFLLNAILV